MSDEDLEKILDTIYSNKSAINDEKEFNYSYPFHDYINSPEGKFVAVVTKSQYAIEIGGFTHEYMLVDLIRKTRPNLEIDCWGNALNPNDSYNNSNAVIYGYPYYVLIDLPKAELLSKNQFECLEKFLLDIKQFNDEAQRRGFGRKYELEIVGSNVVKIETDFYQDKISFLVDQLSHYVSDYVLLLDEVIIGDSFYGNTENFHSYSNKSI